MKITAQRRQAVEYALSERRLTPKQRAKRLVDGIRGTQVSWDSHEVDIADTIRRAEDALMFFVRKHTDFATAEKIEAAYRPNPPV